MCVSVSDHVHVYLCCFQFYLHSFAIFFLIICGWVQTWLTVHICLLCSHGCMYTHIRGGFYWFAKCRGLVHNHCAHFRSVTICWMQSVSPPMCTELTVSRALPEENKAISKYFLVLLYYIIFLELRHCEMKLKGRHFHFSINTDGSLGVSLQMKLCETLNFIDLCEKEELRVNLSDFTQKDV